MVELAQQKCAPCRKESPRVTDAELAELQPQLPEWRIVERAGVPRLERVFNFARYAEAVAFTNRVAELAEKENHHPALLLEWDRVTVSWWTHVLRGLHRNDFILAARTDTLPAPGRFSAGRRGD